MKNKNWLIFGILLLLLMPLRQQAQVPYRVYADNGIEINFFEIGNPDFRLYLLYNLHNGDRFSILAEDEYGLFIVNPTDDGSEANFVDAFEAFYNDASNSFRLIEKVDLDDLVVLWKECVPSMYYTSITMDLAFSRAITLNNHCVDSDPFCTSDVIQFQAANTSQTAEQLEGVTSLEDGCIGSSYNPSWYHMRINTPGQFIIHMEGRDPTTSAERDIDFCMWGPYTDPTTPCVAQLTTAKIIDCNYSSSYSEDIYLGFPEGEHVHQAGHGTVNFHMPETGEYYILMITNYSREPCVITFTKTEGSGPGTTDCGILPGIASNDGPYCVGETIQLNVTTQAGATYSWTGPNGFTSNQQRPVLTDCTLEMAGTYTCVTMVDGQTTSGSTEVIIYPQPAADFTYVEACEGDPVQFTSTSTTNPSGQSINSFEWDFGDGHTASEENPTHTFAQAGDYEVTLSVENGNGLCTDQKTKTVSVYAIPVATATANPTSVMYGGTSTITVNVTSPGTFTYHWEPANMVTNPNSQTTQTVALEETQVYTVTITNTQGGCSTTVQVTVAMAGSNLTATATADEYEICENASTTLHALPVAGTGNYTYNWSPANLLNSTTTQNPVASPPVGTTTFNCTVSDGMTTQEVSVTITVRPHVEHDIFEAICENDTYSYYGQSLHTEGVYDHTLSNQYGCDSILHLHLSVNPNVSSNFSVERCDEYYWDAEGHEIVSTDHDDPLFTETGVYHRTYLNQHGCDSVVTLNAQFEYTPAPTPIYPVDPDNTAPHWVVTATEFQINSYDFHLWDTNPHCRWDSVTWNFENPEIEWVLDPDNEMQPKGQRCTMYVLSHIEDTVWLRATAYNSCSPDGISERYWFVCSFYGIEDGPSTGSGTFNVVPNPNNGHMTLRFENLSSKVDMKVYDMRGVLLDHFEAANGYGDSTFEYDMKHDARGIYFFVATSKEGTMAKKVIIE
jgi:PKD repeat protein